MHNETKAINTTLAPAAIGSYSQAVRINETVYLSGQIGINPETPGQLVGPDLKSQLYQVFDNIKAVCEAAGGSMSNIIKLTIYVIDLEEFPLINDVMSRYFNAPYPARATVQVSRLPKNALIEIDGIMILNSHWDLGV